MDKKLLAVAFAVIASGCVHTGLPTDSALDTNTQSSESKGLEISKFDVSDDAIGPGQTGLIILELRNHHRQEIDIQDISLYNTGILEAEKLGCSPSKSELETAREDYIPGMKCRWRVEAPEEQVSGFESKRIPVKLNLEYESQLSNSESPIKVHFKPLSEITKTSEFTEKFSNDEVSMEINSQSPVPFEGRTMTVRVQNAGNGRVSSDFSFDYFPEEVFPNCKENHEPIVEQQVEFTCDIEPQGDTSSTRNIIVSTSYKYVKAPTLDVEVVNR